MTKTLLASGLLALVLPACGGGGGGSASGALTPFAISAAGNTGVASNLLEPGDSFQAETDVAAASALWDQIWAVLIGAPTWTGTNPLNTYQFFDDIDPNTNWGRAYRFTGFNVFAGPIRTPIAILGSGTYTAAGGATYPAMILQTWDDTFWEIVVIRDATTMVHANQNVNGLPIPETFRS